MLLLLCYVRNLSRKSLILCVNVNTFITWQFLLFKTLYLTSHKRRLCVILLRERTPAFYHDNSHLISYKSLTKCSPDLETLNLGSSDGFCAPPPGSFCHPRVIFDATSVLHHVFCSSTPAIYNIYIHVLPLSLSRFMYYLFVCRGIQRNNIRLSVAIV